MEVCRQQGEKVRYKSEARKNVKSGKFIQFLISRAGLVAKPGR
jgi:hypothetical protein